jgi:hypothetical protein
VALLHNNLGVKLWGFEGPAASLEAYRDGIAYAKARGLIEMLDMLSQGTVEALVDTGEHDELLRIAAEMAPRLEASGDAWALVGMRAAQARVFGLRGPSELSAEVLEWLELTARGVQDPQLVASGLGSAALVRAGLGQGEVAATLLTEIESYPGARDNQNYLALLPAMVRTALGIGEPVLAERLVGGIEPRTPYAEHALVATDAALTEARGDLQSATDAYADAAGRWERFGVIPEQGFALLGQGRCLLGLSRSSEAEDVLGRAREIFDALGAAPALAETDALLQEATPLSS